MQPIVLIFSSGYAILCSMAVELLSSGAGYRIGAIATEPEAQAKRGWQLAVNGEIFTAPVSSVSLHHPKMGVELAYGQRPEGYDGFVLKEPGGGGSVTIPYFIKDKQLYIGVVEEKRPTATDGKPTTVLNVPRGFLDPGETHFQAAVRELREEAGFTPIHKRIKEMRGKPMNPNSTFFVTGKDKGVKVYGVSVEDKEIVLVKADDDPTKVEYRFNPDQITPTSKMGEKIAGSKFVHWSKVVDGNDMFSNAGVSRLIAEHPELFAPPKPESQAVQKPKSFIKRWLSRIRGN